VNAAPVAPPIASKTVFRRFHSVYLAKDAGQVEQAGWVSNTMTSRSGFG